MEIKINRRYIPMPRTITIDLTAKEFEALEGFVYEVRKKDFYNENKIGLIIECKNNRQYDLILKIIKTLINKVEKS